MHSQANSEEHFPDLFSSSCLRSIYVLLTIIKYRLFQCKLCEISGLPSYSQRLKLHIFLLTSLHLNFEVWLWKSLAHPCKTNGKTQRAALFGITQGCLRRYYLCLSQSTAKMISLLLKNQSIPFLCTHLPGARQSSKGTPHPPYFKDNIDPFVCQPVQRVTAATIFLHLEIILEQRWLPADPGQDLDAQAQQDLSYRDLWEQSCSRELVRTLGTQTRREAILVIAAWRREEKRQREGSFGV